ncbi:hypothetical protein CJ030_MR2G004716 [Morella rubra]|uniref:Uncharacterized protein n=1 Tax=Morella rubra TaxID=262757 RepID=A0A6A1WLH8_9ROSI|nr:hypothetical protein CJ030_MR2G004716 [Morella rubra]
MGGQNHVESMAKLDVEPEGKKRNLVEETAHPLKKLAILEKSTVIETTPKEKTLAALRLKKKKPRALKKQLLKSADEEKYKTTSKEVFFGFGSD